MQLSQFDKVYEEILSNKSGWRKLLPFLEQEAKLLRKLSKIEGEELEWHFSIGDLLSSLTRLGSLLIISKITCTLVINSGEIHYPE
jgi:hypothetical protein